MAGPRNPKLSKELHDYIYNEWVFKQRNAYQITNTMNGSTELTNKYGKINVSGVNYHLHNIKKELEDVVSDDAIDTYVAEFIRLKEGIDQDVAALDKMLELCNGAEDIETELKIRRHRHEVKLDKFRMLQDAELPLAVKKMKMERNKRLPKPNVVKSLDTVHEVEDNMGKEFEGSSE